jgi:streptomycin 6-kinase
MPVTIPERLAQSCRNSPERMAWLEALPVRLSELEREWSLEARPPFDGPEVSCSYVARVTRPDGTRAVLKLGMPHREGQHEIAGLRFWNGNPTVRLLDADDDAGAMLLEACEPGSPLRESDESEQDGVIAGLLRRLWRAPTQPHPFRPLSQLLAYWSEETLGQAEQWPDPGLVREGLRLFQELPGSAPEQVLLATDLHAGNVLRAEREPWLVIDPKPFVGDPAYDGTQHLLNCPSRLLGNPGEIISRFADLLGVDRERLRLWTLARGAADPRPDWRHSVLQQIAKALGK